MAADKRPKQNRLISEARGMLRRKEARILVLQQDVYQLKRLIFNHETIKKAQANHRDVWFDYSPYYF